MDDIRAITKHMQRSFENSFKFESSMVTEVDSDTGKISTNSGYREEPLSSLGYSGVDKPQHGDSVVQVSGMGTGSLPISIGKTDWLVG